MNLSLLRSLWRRFVLRLSEETPSPLEETFQGSLPDRLTLTIQEYAVLEKFYRAQRPHIEPKTWHQLRKAGHKPVERERMDLRSICNIWNASYKDTPLPPPSARTARKRLQTVLTNDRSN